MRVSSFVLAVTAFSAVAEAIPSTSYVDWKTFKATGVNLGGWLVQEAVLDAGFWDTYGGNTTDEWGLCVRLGSQCGPVLERRYATFFRPSDIDKLAKAGVEILRIPTNYAAWIKVPGSQLYSGSQVEFLRTIATYAITKHNMHIVIDIHSLPGGINGLGIGEKDGSYGWFNNQTALDYSYQAVDAVVRFIEDSGYPQSYTLAPINEPVDNRDFSKFGTPEALSENGAAWVAKYINGVLARVQAVNPHIPVMFQGSFRPESFWSPYFDAGENLVFDEHHYYFAGRPTTSENLPSFICEDAKSSVGDGKFPIFIGEWSIQAVNNNTFASRARNLNNGLYVWSKYTQGSTYWTAKFSGDAPVDGQGTQSDYWNYEGFIDSGIIMPNSADGFCP
ncbi:putative glucan 1,3-beta-glucosidase A [Colletotrichum siamense]|uniref:glucan 1,3-beta-glucosidase n=1 Tax=Colletotrichum siamense TaxID=690259 RepID=A0A9P5BTW0_COLSI|nr:putative glucan 1,3-beta-glucosidase A [Colletotrichum siamense]KAF4844095.1 putative glucan 1,3-beta-glucosidase A [Colletotrichum siamense]KAF4849926.1 putative glucan 1,3-beta-glucosidase A [Colletotrichum siamense]KAF5487665.1 putative glucan 1,3-beta-glucosidase A [Colletotrichum siamense]